MDTLKDIETKIAVKIKTFALAVIKKDRILLRSKEQELMKQQEFIGKETFEWY